MNIITRTQDEIDRQINGLIKMKDTLPEISFFGTNNWDVIDAQVSILRGEKTADDYYKGEGSEEIEFWSQASLAQEWLDGENEVDLFE